MANPYLCIRDPSIAVPTAFQVFGYAQGGFTGYRWLFVTAITGGREYGNLANLGAIYGDQAPNTGGLATWTAPSTLPEKYRVYCFNAWSQAGLFNPWDNPTPAGLVAADGGPLVVRFKEIPALPNNHGVWPPETEFLTHELLFLSDGDGTDYFGGQPTTGPTGTFTVTPATLPAGGGNATLTWTSANATSAEILEFGPVDLQGSRPVVVNDTETWTLRLTGPSGVTLLQTTIIVGGNPPTPTPPITGVGLMVKVYARAVAGSATSHTLHIGDEATSVTVPTVDNDATVPTAVRYGPFSAAEFDALEFGIERLTSGGTLSLFACCGEVLHATPQLAAPTWEGVGLSYGHQVGSYVGTGAFLDVTGLEVRPRAVLVKKLDGASSAGAIRVGRLGGTVARLCDAATELTDAIQNLTADGFELGPHASVNEAGVTYVFLAVQDGQAGASGPYFTDVVWFRTITSSRVILLPWIRPDHQAAWTPEVILAQGNTLTAIKYPEMVQDEALPLTNSTTSAGLITATAPASFTVGTAETNQFQGANSLTPLLALCWRRVEGVNDLQAQAFTWGNFAGTGSPVTVTGVPFAPCFLLEDHRGGGYTGHYRHVNVGVGGTSSYDWSTANADANGITAPTADGFTVAAAASVVGQTTYWGVWKEVAVFAPENPDPGDGNPPPPEITPDGTLCAGGGLKVGAGAPDGTNGCTAC